MDQTNAPMSHAKEQLVVLFLGGYVRVWTCSLGVLIWSLPLSVGSTTERGKVSDCRVHTRNPSKQPMLEFRKLLFPSEWVRETT